MDILSRQPLCVVLNNQHQIRLDEYLAVHQTTPDRAVLFQPYTDKHLRQVYDILKNSTDPVPIFLVVGAYGEVTKAVGLLHSLEYQDSMSDDRKQELRQMVSKYDDDLYALNILSVSNLLSFRNDLPLRTLFKHSDGKPLEPGQWTASICHTPLLSKIIQSL